MRELTKRQSEIYDYIKKIVQTKGYPPSVREIGEAVGLASSSTVHGHLSRLEEKGYIRRDPTKPRAIEIVSEQLDEVNVEETIHVPVIGKVTAGVPITAVENIEDHDMHSEYYTLDEDTARIINRTKEDGGRVFSVGTTSTRTLETIARDNNGKIVAASGWTNIFIYPGFEFKCVDGLITNFHLPKSSLIMLVSAFYDREKVIELYNIAVENKYRFFSFGDAMIII